jgi:hypothetical protein
MKNVEEYCARLEREVEDQRLAAQQMRKAWIDRGTEIERLREVVNERDEDIAWFKTEVNRLNAVIRAAHPIDATLAGKED